MLLNKETKLNNSDCFYPTNSETIPAYETLVIILFKKKYF